MALTDSLVSYWKFDNSAADAHASNDLSAGNSATYNAGGILNQCSDLERGTQDYWYIADGSQTGLDLNGQTAFSMQFWLKLESAPSTNTAFVLQDKRQGDTNGYSIRYSDDAGTKGLYVRWKDNTNTSERGLTQTLTPGSWYHVVIVVNISTPGATFYINNSSTAGSGSDSAATQITNSSQQFVLGNDSGASPANGYDGFMDEVGLWTRALTSDEVSQLYNSGSGLSYDDFGGGGAAVTSDNNWLLMGV